MPAARSSPSSPRRSLAAWDQFQAEVFAIPDFGDWFARMEPLVTSGQREFYNIEA
jgi:hypothetical protein